MNIYVKIATMNIYVKKLQQSQLKWLFFVAFIKSRKLNRGGAQCLGRQTLAIFAKISKKISLHILKIYTLRDQGVRKFSFCIQILSASVRP